MEWVGNAVAESKQEGSGQHHGKRTTPPNGIGRGLQEKATNRRAEGQGAGEGHTVERQVAAEQMGWSHVRDQRPENENVCAFADCEDDRNAGEETGRSELRVDERRWQNREQADRKKRACRRESVSTSHPRHYAYRWDLRDDDEGRVDENDDPDSGRAERCVGLCKWGQDVGEERVADDDEHDIGCDHREEESISSDGAKAGSVGVCRCDGLGSRARYGSEHDQRESGGGGGVEEIERLERAEPLRGCDDEAGYGRAGADTEVARDAVKSKGGSSLLALDQPDGQ